MFVQVTIISRQRPVTDADLRVALIKASKVNYLFSNPTPPGEEGTAAVGVVIASGCVPCVRLDVEIKGFPASLAGLVDLSAVCCCCDSARSRAAYSELDVSARPSKAGLSPADLTRSVSGIARVGVF